MNYTPITELEAVNDMLRTIGEQPVNTLITNGVSEASIAYDVLHLVSREVQTLGLECNSEKEYLLLRDVDGYINVPANTLRIDGFYHSDDVVWRGTRLYDRHNHTYIFEDDIDVDITFFLPFTELPQVVRQYIYIKAARRFQAQLIGSDTLDGFKKEDEARAWAALFTEELAVADANITDTYETYKIVSRRI